MKCNPVLNMCCPYIKVHKILLNTCISVFKLHRRVATRSSENVKKVRGLQEERKRKYPRDPETLNSLTNLKYSTPALLKHASATHVVANISETKRYKAISEKSYSTLLNSYCTTSAWEAICLLTTLHISFWDATPCISVNFKNILTKLHFYSCRLLQNASQFLTDFMTSHSKRP